MVYDIMSRAPENTAIWLAEYIMPEKLTYEYEISAAAVRFVLA